MSIPAPSAHERVFLCPASDVLPQVREAEVDGATSRGLAIHGYLAAIPRIGWERALAEVPPEWRADCEVIELGRLPAVQPESFAAEVCLAYDMTTGTARVLGHDLGYEEMKRLLAPSEMPAKIDTISLTIDTVLLWDYKSGRRRNGPVRTIRQLRAYALAAARAYGKSRAIVGIIRIGEDGRPWFDGGTEETGLLDELELALVEEELHDLVARRDEAGRTFRAGNLPRLVVGEHCTYCPALPGCPAHMVGLRALASDGAFAALAQADQDAAEKLWRATTEKAVAVATDAELTRALDAVKVAKRRLEYLEKSLVRRAAQQPIPRGDGSFWGPRPQDAVADFELAKATLAVMYGDAAAEAAVIPAEPSMSKESIGEALRKHVLPPGGKISHLEKECFQALRDSGAIRPETRFKWYRPTKEELQQAAPAAPAATPAQSQTLAAAPAANQDEIPFGGTSEEQRR